MAFGSLEPRHDSNLGTQSEINMVPLIDVMLVLLVIFMITAPLLTHAIKIDVPKVSSQQVNEDPKSIDVAIDQDGRFFWNDTPIEKEDLAERLSSIAKEEPQPELRVRADADTRYEVLAELMAAAKNTGIKRLGFITTPKFEGGAAVNTAKPLSGSTPAVTRPATP